MRLSRRFLPARGRAPPVRDHEDGPSYTRMYALTKQLRLVCIYTLVALVMIQPLVNLSALGSASYEGDARLMIWTLAWNNHALLNGLPLFDANIFYPASSSLSNTDHMFGVSLFTLPIYAATRNPVLAYNIVWVLSFILCGLAMHALAARHTGSGLASLAAGLIFTYSFYRMHHAPGHLSLIWIWPLPLSLLLLERWIERPTAGAAAAWAGMTVLQALTSWYLAVVAFVANAVVLMWLTATSVRSDWQRRVLQLLVVTCAGVLLVLPFALPYRNLPPSSTAEMAGMSADLAAYLIPPANTWSGRLWLQHVGPEPRWIWGERTLFLGYIAIVLAAAGTVRLTRRRLWRQAGPYAALMIVGFALSFGPTVGGREGWSPFSVLAQVPGFSGFRAPARFAVLVVLGVSLLAAHAVAGAQKRFGPRGALALAGLLPLMLAEWYIVDFPGGKPQPFDIPPIYGSDAIRRARAVVSLPDYRGRPDWFLGADYLYFSTAHWRPIVNGYGRAEPPGHQRVVSHMMAFPGPNNARTMRALGVEYVVLHSARYGGAEDIVRAARESPHYDLVAEMGSDYLFKVKPSP